MAWDVELVDEAADWFLQQDTDTRRQITAAIDMLTEQGPTLGRPVVAQVKGSKHHNLKELRVGKSIRILFLFDPRSTAIILVGGDKSGQWNDWYAEQIPVAEALYDQYLNDLRNEGLID